MKQRRLRHRRLHDLPDNVRRAAIAVLIGEVEHEGDAAFGSNGRREGVKLRERLAEVGGREIELDALQLFALPGIRETPHPRVAHEIEFRINRVAVCVDTA